VPKAVAARVRSAIARGALRPGDRLPSERELVEELGISRATLREAIRLLESDGLVTLRRGSRGGVFVTWPDTRSIARQAGLWLQLNGATVRDVFYARTLLEPPAAALLAQKCLSDDIDALRATVDGIAASAGVTSVAQHFSTFHHEIVRRSGSTTLAALGMLLDELTAETWERFALVRRSKAPDDVYKAVQSCERLVEHIAAGDAEAAEAHWRLYLQGLAAKVTDTALLDLFD
jgi:DNA-binding FadR family transcriptional regulator